MRVDAYIIVREINPRGLESLHREEVDGKALLHHVIEKCQKIKNITEIALICEELTPFLEQCREKYNVRLHNSTLEDNPRRSRFRRCRRWSVEGWRGGLHYVSSYDEDAWPQAFTIVHESFPCDLIYQVGAEWLCLDVELSEKIIDHAINVKSSAKMVFHQACPGFIGSLYHPDTLHHMATTNLSIRDAFAVNNKGSENHDEANGAGNFDVSPALGHSLWRFTADTTRQLNWLKNLNPENVDVAEDWIKAANEQPFAAGPCREVDLEWVAENNVDFMSDEVFEKIKTELLEHNDSLLTVDGRGNLLKHPKWLEHTKSLVADQVHGLHLRISAEDLSDEHVPELIACGATVISFVMDSVDCESEASKRVQLICENKDHLAGPLIVVELARKPELIPLWEVFWHHWFPYADQMLWRYPSHHGHHFEDQSDLNLLRRFRHPCRKLFKELLIYFDGSVPLCREDWEGQEALGHLEKNSLQELTLKAQNLWLQHRDENYSKRCNSCDAWDRLTP
jgi:radical SAM protein with 4Fe4S-binding SPASM domain